MSERPDQPTTEENLSTPAPEESGSLPNELDRLREENRKLADQLLRVQAEMENTRKRLVREKEEFMQFSMANTVQSLLPVLDGFELALENPGTGEEYRKGIQLIYQQLQTALIRMGLEPIQAEGQPFDPHFHEAIATFETNEVPDQQVVGEMQRGYLFKNRLLRPARVRVARHRSSADSNSQPE